MVDGVGGWVGGRVAGLCVVWVLCVDALYVCVRADACVCMGVNVATAVWSVWR